MSIRSLIAQWARATLEDNGKSYAYLSGALESMLEIEIERSGDSIHGMLGDDARAGVTRMAERASRHLATYPLALELARNVAVGALDGQDVYQVAREAIRHRMEYFALECADVDGCAMSMSLAWTGARRAA